MMNAYHYEHSYPSSDGIHQIHADIYAPPTRAPRAIVQLAHGMVDHVGRYGELWETLTREGYVFAGNDHLGHGKSVSDPAEYGFFAEEGGVDFILRDMHALTEFLKKQYPGVPLVVMGHSMGSFIARLFVNRYSYDVDGFIMHGSAGPNPVLPLGKTVAKAVAAIYGKRHRSRLIKNLAFMGYNSHFDKKEGENAWLTRDETVREETRKDPYKQFIFTVGAYLDLFYMLGACNAREWFGAFPKNLKTLILGGTEDPVGNYGRGLSYVYKQLLLAGATSVSLKLYEGARHELWQDLCREEVHADILAFLGSVCQ